jgi:hypothetical protein
MKVQQGRKKKLVKASPTWLWAHKHDNRITKHWNWRLVGAMEGIEHKSCVPFALYKWKAFGFDGKEQPMWAINDYMNEWHEYADQRLQGD